MLSLLLCTIVIPYTFAFSPQFPYGKEKIRGVNLGGWLVLEPWITPSLFDNTNNPHIVDEWTFCQLQDQETAAHTLKHHWDTWITKADFQAIAAAGLNHVRLPIGYWAWDVSDGEPYIQGQLSYLQKAVKWAEEFGLQVIVDLHGAPGSQNGFDNSGHRLPAPTWHTRKANVDRTNAVIKKIADAFKDSASVVSAIAPLNEPKGTVGESMLSVVKQYWYDSYGNIRFPFGSSRESDAVVVIHDAFQPLSYWKGFMPPSTHQGVMLDTHRYQVFSDDENQRSDSEHIQAACAQGQELATFHLWVVVGEWVPAPTDCAKYLNGLGVGSRYDGTKKGSTRVGSCRGKTGKASTFSPAYKDFLRRYWEAQAITYEKGAGWIQWTWKTEMADDWSYEAGLANGWIPKHAGERTNPRICD